MRIFGFLVTLMLWASPAFALDGGPYGEVRQVTPSGPMRGLVIFFSDRGGWTPRDQAMLDAMAAKGAIALGVDTDVYLAKLAAGNAACDQLVGDAEGLSRQLQRQHGDIDYQSPILAGIGQGGTLAAAILAQAPANTLAGAVSLDPARMLMTGRPLCAGQPFTPEGRKGFVYGPLKHLPGFWIAGLTSAGSSAGRAHVEELRKLGMPVDVRELADTAPAGALGALIEPHLFQGEIGRAPIGDISALPLVELPVVPPSPLMAVVISGDGGWRDLDKTIAEELQKDGVPSVGWDSVRYFWHRKTPDQTAADLAAILETYAAKWHARKFALIGYSFGADVMPAIYNRLPARLRDRVVLISLLGFTSAADWEITLSGWLGAPPSDQATPVAPELAKIPPGTLQCLYGQDETDSACPSLVSRGVEIVRTTGGHHFDGDYAGLEKRILARFRERAGE